MTTAPNIAGLRCPRARWLWAAGLAFGLALAAAGCQAHLSRTAPEVASPVLRAGQARGLDADALARGRQLYLSRCGSCHNLEPLDSYRQAQWQAIMPRMNRLSGFDAAQGREVTGYVLSAHAALASSPEGAAGPAP